MGSSEWKNAKLADIAMEILLHAEQDMANTIYPSSHLFVPIKGESTDSFGAANVVAVAKALLAVTCLPHESAK